MSKLYECVIFISLIAFALCAGCINSATVTTPAVAEKTTPSVNSTPTGYVRPTFEPIRTPKYVRTQTTVTTAIPLKYEPIIGVWTITNMSTEPKIVFKSDKSGTASALFISKDFYWTFSDEKDGNNRSYNVNGEGLAGKIYLDVANDTAICDLLKGEQFLVRK